MRGKETYRLSCPADGRCNSVLCGEATKSKGKSSSITCCHELVTPGIEAEIPGVRVDVTLEGEERSPCWEAKVVKS